MKLVEKNSTIRLLVATAAMTGLLTLGAGAQDAGFGNDIPIGAAVKQIVPQGNTVRLGDGVDSNVRVSWTGDGGWRRAVEQAAADAGYSVSYDGTVVSINAPPAAAAVVAAAPANANNSTPAAPAAAAVKPTASSVTASAPAPRPAAAAASPKPTATTPRPSQQPQRPSVQQMPVVSGGGFVLIPETQVASVAPAGGEGWKDYGTQRTIAAPIAPTWQVNAGDDLNLILNEWAAKEGWRVRWESEFVYTLQSPARFSGDFVTAATELLRGMQDARPAVTAKFFEGNKVLLVGNGSLGEVN